MDAIDLYHHVLMREEGDKTTAALLVLAHEIGRCADGLDAIGLNRGRDGRGLGGMGTLERSALALEAIAEAIGTVGENME